MGEEFKTSALFRAGVFCFLLLALGGCALPEEKADLVIINGNDPETLDPALGTGIEDLRVIMSLFEGLTRYNPTNARAMPGLAERWSISPDGRQYTFFLRSNLVWSSGGPISSEDVVYSWRRVLDPKTASAYAGQLFYLKNAEEYYMGKSKNPDEVGVRADGPFQVVVDLKAPTAFFLDLCAFQTLAVVPKQWIEKYGDGWLRQNPVPASGPYLLDEWKINNRIRLRKNPKYWDAANTKNGIVDLLHITHPGTVLNLYTTGGADIIWDKDLLPAELLDLLIQRPDCHTFDYLGAYFIRMNTTRKPLDDVRVRRALALALDKQRIVSRVTGAGEKAAMQFVPPGVANYRSFSMPGSNVEEAKRLLQEALGGQQLTLTYLFDSGSKIHAKVAVELQSALMEALGIRLELRQMEKKTYLAAQRGLDYDISQSSWIGDYNDPNTFLDLFVSNNGNNRTGWASEEYDRLINLANAEPDLGKRAELLARAEKLLLQEGPIIPLYFYRGLNFYDTNKLGGVFSNLLDIHPLQTIYHKN